MLSIVHDRDMEGNYVWILMFLMVPYCVQYTLDIFATCRNGDEKVGLVSK